MISSGVFKYERGMGLVPYYSHTKQFSFHSSINGLVFTGKSTPETIWKPIFPWKNIGFSGFNCPKPIHSFNHCMAVDIPQPSMVQLRNCAEVLHLHPLQHHSQCARSLGAPRNQWQVGEPWIYGIFFGGIKPYKTIVSSRHNFCNFSGIWRDSLIFLGGAIELPTDIWISHLFSNLKRSHWPTSL